MIRLYNLEFTNACTAKCSYCPHGQGTLTRKKTMLTDKNFNNIIDYLQYSKQTEIQVSGLGEPLLHKKAIQYLQDLCAIVKVQLNTNGLLLSQEKYDTLTKAGISRIIVNYLAHNLNPYTLINRHTDNLYYMCLDKTKEDKANGLVYKELHSWGEDKAKIRDCNFISDDWVSVDSEGVIQRCCIAYNSDYPITTIDKLHEYNSVKDIIHPKCNTCTGFKFKTCMVYGDYTGEKDGNGI